MFQRILLAWDGSEVALRAFDAAIDVTRHHDAELVAVSIAHSPAHAETAAGRDETIDAAHRYLEQTFAEVIDRAHRAGRLLLRSRPRADRERRADPRHKRRAAMSLRRHPWRLTSRQTPPVHHSRRRTRREQIEPGRRRTLRVFSQTAVGTAVIGGILLLTPNDALHTMAAFLLAWSAGWFAASAYLQLQGLIRRVRRSPKR